MLFALPWDAVNIVYVRDGRVVGLDPSDPIRVSYDRPVGDEPTGAAHPELLAVKPSHGHDNTIINGISRIGYMAGGKSARWDDRTMADTLTGEASANSGTSSPRLGSLRKTRTR